MFRGLFGTNNDRPTPPKNQIEVVCPACGAAQYEPRLVVSTFCKKCGVHLSIHKRKVTASSVTRSGAGGANHDWGRSEPSKKVESAPPPASEPEVREIEESSPPSADETGLDIVIPPTAEESEEGGFGVFLKQQSSPTPPPATPASSASSPLKAISGGMSRTVSQPEAVATPPPPATPTASESAEETEPSEEEDKPRTSFLKRPQSNSPAPTPAPAPMSQSTLQKMKDQGMYRNQYFKDSDCFDCGHKFKVSRSSKSANCPNCGAHILMEDIEINMSSTMAIKTRGDVLIRKRGHLSTSSVQCKDLRCHGSMEANVSTSGDAIFRTTGTIIGEIHCRRFMIEKGADVTFMNSVYAEEVDIQARVTGTLFSSGAITIHSNGSVNGDVTARSVSIEPGGELNGAMNIVRTQIMPRPTFNEP